MAGRRVFRHRRAGQCRWQQWCSSSSSSSGHKVAVTARPRQRRWALCRRVAVAGGPVRKVRTSCEGGDVGPSSSSSSSRQRHRGRAFHRRRRIRQCIRQCKWQCKWRRLWARRYWRTRRSTRWLRWLRQRCDRSVVPHRCVRVSVAVSRRWRRCPSVVVDAAAAVSDAGTWRHHRRSGVARRVVVHRAGSRRRQLHVTQASAHALAATTTTAAAVVVRCGGERCRWWERQHRSCRCRHGAYATVVANAVRAAHRSDSWVVTGGIGWRSAR